MTLGGQIRLRKVGRLPPDSPAFCDFPGRLFQTGLKLTSHRLQHEGLATPKDSQTFKRKAEPMAKIDWSYHRPG